MKTAVVLFNLGGPDAPESIKPFLFNFFMDKNIIRLPLPLRFLVAKLIARRRSRREAGDSYGLLGGRSPLLENTTAQAQALQQKLGADYRVFVCMRYWHPMTRQVAAEVATYAPDKIVLLPLYPQFSTTTTRSSLRLWKKEAARAGLAGVSSKTVCCYPVEPGFIAAAAEAVKNAYGRAREKSDKKPRVLFSAHGLPESVVKDGDPYQRQCENTAQAIAAALGITDLDWTICYQSRVGPMKWIGPSTEEELERAARDKVPVVTYPHAFVSEHVETLVEIEIEYREKAHEMGIEVFERAETAGTSARFIDGLARLVQEAECKTGYSVAPGGGYPPCGKEWRRCCLRDKQLNDRQRASGV